MKSIKNFKEQTEIEYFAFSVTAFFMMLLFLARKTYAEYEMISFREEANVSYIVMGLLLLIGYWLKNKIALYVVTVLSMGFFLLINYFIHNYFISLRPLLYILVVLQIGIKYPPPSSYFFGVISLLFSLLYLDLSLNWHRIMIYVFVDFLFFSILSLYLKNREEAVKKELIVQQHIGSIKKLTRANHQFLEYLENVEIESAEKERNRITRELHDSIGYALTNVSAMMEAIPYLYENDSNKLFEFCKKSQDLSNSVMQEVRSTLYVLRSIKEQNNYNPTLFFFNFCKEFREATGIKTEFFPLSLPPGFDDSVFKVLYRAAQVGFINALRHAHADHIKLFLHQTDSNIELIIWNNLKSHYIIPDSEQHKGIGLRGIDERLSLLGGISQHRFVVDGFELILTIPIKES